MVARNRRRDAFVKTSLPETLIRDWTRFRMDRKKAAGSGTWLRGWLGQGTAESRRTVLMLPMPTGLGGMHGVGTMMQQRKCEGMVVQRKLAREVSSERETSKWQSMQRSERALQLTPPRQFFSQWRNDPKQGSAGSFVLFVIWHSPALRVLLPDSRRRPISSQLTASRSGCMSSRPLRWQAQGC